MYLDALIEWYKKYAGDESRLKVRNLGALRLRALRVQNQMTNEIWDFCGKGHAFTPVAHLIQWMEVMRMFVMRIKRLCAKCASVDTFMTS